MCRAEIRSAAAVDAIPPFALTDLQRAVSLDDKLVEAQLLIGKLQSLPLGDENAARKALSKVDRRRGCHARTEGRGICPAQRVQKDEKKQLADLNRAVELQPEKPDYLRCEPSICTARKSLTMRWPTSTRRLKLEPDHAATNELRGMILLGLDKYDEA